MAKKIRCKYCYKRYDPEGEDHYYSGTCVKAKESTKQPKIPKERKKNTKYNILDKSV